MAGYLWQKVGPERNGGNITLNITEYVDDEIRALPAISEVKQIGKTPLSERLLFYCKGTQMRMRDLARWPMANGSIIRILDDCASYVIIADQPVMPTSELPSHLAVHNYLLEKKALLTEHLCIHPIELIAMTHNKKFLEKDVATNLLWSMIPETKAFLSSWIGYNSLWIAKFGKIGWRYYWGFERLWCSYVGKVWSFAVDVDIMSAFDQVDVLNKSALIYIAAKNMGFEPDGMSQEQMKEMTGLLIYPNKSEVLCTEWYWTKPLISEQGCRKTIAVEAMRRGLRKRSLWQIKTWSVLKSQTK